MIEQRYRLGPFLPYLLGATLAGDVPMQAREAPPAIVSPIAHRRRRRSTYGRARVKRGAWTMYGRKVRPIRRRR